MTHPMMKDRVVRPWQTWTVDDEMKLEELIQEHPFLRRLGYRYSKVYGPPVRAPWEVRLSPERGARNRRDS